MAPHRAHFKRVTNIGDMFLDIFPKLGFHNKSWCHTCVNFIWWFLLLTIYIMQVGYYKDSELKKICYCVEFQNKKTKIHDGNGKLIGTSEKWRGNLLYLDISSETCMFAQQEDVWL